MTATTNPEYRLDALAGSEQNIRDFIETHMIDDCGLVLSHLNPTTLRPWTSAEIANGGYDLPSFCHPHCADPDAYLAYEDSLMATGEYAHSQVLRYEVTGDAQALVTAGHQVSALLRVLFEGEKFEKGFLPKPFGGIRRAAHLSHELSPDQYIKCMAALRAYERYAPQSLQRTIDDYLVSIADYFVARNFLHPRRESMVVTPENRPHACAHYIPAMVLAHEITGDDAYLGYLDRFDAVLRALALGTAQPVFNIGSLWMEGIHMAARAGWQDERIAQIVRVLWETHAARVHDNGWGHNGDDPRIITSRVVRVAAFAPIAEAHCPDIEAGPAALRILEQITNPHEMRLTQPSAAGLLPPGRRWTTQVICETSISSWLHAYWRLRAHLAGMAPA